MNAAEIPASACPECGYACDRSTSAVGQTNVPKPGDVSLCLNCGHVAEFDEGLRIVPMGRRKLLQVMGSSIGPQLRTLQIQIAGRGPIIRTTDVSADH